MAVFRQQEMKSLGIAAATSTALLDARNYDRDVSVTFPSGASNAALSLSSITNAQQGWILQDNTTRFTLAAGHSLWVFCDVATVVGVNATPCGSVVPMEEQEPVNGIFYGAA